MLGDVNSVGQLTLRTKVFSITEQANALLHWVFLHVLLSRFEEMLFHLYNHWLVQISLLFLLVEIKQHAPFQQLDGCI